MSLLLCYTSHTCVVFYMKSYYHFDLLIVKEPIKANTNIWVFHFYYKSFVVLKNLSCNKLSPKSGFTFVPATKVCVYSRSASCKCKIRFQFVGASVVQVVGGVIN